MTDIKSVPEIAAGLSEAMARALSYHGHRGPIAPKPSPHTVEAVQTRNLMDHNRELTELGNQVLDYLIKVEAPQEAPFDQRREEALTAIEHVLPPHIAAMVSVRIKYANPINGRVPTHLVYEVLAMHETQQQIDELWTTLRLAFTHRDPNVRRSAMVLLDKMATGSQP